MSNFSLPRSAGRVGLAASAAAFLAFGLAAPAAADEVETYEGSAEGTYIGNAESGPNVHLTGEGEAKTSLFNLKLTDGTVLTTYCIDFQTNIVKDADYKEDDWANYPGKGAFAEPGKVLWILQNSYPNVGAAELGEKAGFEGLSNEDALAATQAAIWHFSNDTELDEGNSGAVEAVYGYLTENAEDVAQEPGAALSITPNSAEGKAGETIGEFVVETNAAEIPVNLGEDVPEGVELVDIESGEVVESVNNGDKVGFAVPEGTDEGTASFSLEASSHVETGRLFQGKSHEEPTQTLITVDGDETSVSAGAGVTWAAGEGETPPPADEPSEPEVPAEEPSEPVEEPSKPAEEKPTPPASDEPALAVTGGALAGLVAAGVAALGAGGAAIYLSRKRKAATGEDTDV